MPTSESRRPIVGSGKKIISDVPQWFLRKSCVHRTGKPRDRNFGPPSLNSGFRRSTPPPGGPAPRSRRPRACADIESLLRGFLLQARKASANGYANRCSLQVALRPYASFCFDFCELTAPLSDRCYRNRYHLRATPLRRRHTRNRRCTGRSTACTAPHDGRARAWRFRFRAIDEGLVSALIVKYRFRDPISTATAYNSACRCPQCNYIGAARVGHPELHVAPR